MELRNATIKSASISTEDHNCLMVWLVLDYGGSQQGFGGYPLYSPKHKDKTGQYLWRLMQIAGVSKWENIVGKPVRVRGTNSGIEAIGHFLLEDWFEPAKELEDA